MIMKMSSIDIQIKRSHRARRMRLAIFHNGQIVLTLPINAKIEVANKFIKEKEDWIRSKVDYFKSIEKNNVKYTPLEVKILKREARELVKERLTHFNKFYNFHYRRVVIKSQRTRWGSCSSKGNLNFNWKIALIDKKLSDYIVVHELCHLKELNHSKRFWDLVALTIPDYKERILELKKSGIALS